MTEELGYPKDRIKYGGKAPDIGMGPRLEPLPTPELDEPDPPPIEDTEPLPEPDLHEPILAEQPSVDLPNEAIASPQAQELPPLEVPNLGSTDNTVEMLTGSDADDIIDSVAIPNVADPVSLSESVDISGPSEARDISLPPLEIPSFVDSDQPDINDPAPHGAMQTAELADAGAFASYDAVPIQPVGDHTPMDEVREASIEPLAIPQVDDVATETIRHAAGEVDRMELSAKATAAHDSDFGPLTDRLDRIEGLLTRLITDSASGGGMRFQR